MLPGLGKFFIAGDALRQLRQVLSSLPGGDARLHKPSDIPHRKELSAIARLMIDLTRQFVASQFNTAAPGRHLELWFIVALLWPETLRGHGLTATDITQASGMTKSTVDRKLKQLLRSGHVVRGGHHKYYVSDRELKSGSQRYEQTAARVLKAVEQLR